ncbi:GNAT family N-acetyltransferase [Planococcus salinus]|uniref:GNAT family N-acetyltransferase n=1 Tax=Planococcus salinus TaxID=1848460 RepID=A0A3M8PBX4_9BACL|nr:GNAT family N-acetyltransferase [Planococcus salinus]RNF41209.1 GNAT family N-acetyltransferase [Planococcus salinus]
MHIEQVTMATIHSVVPLFDAYRQFTEQPTDVQAVKEFLEERVSKEESIIFIALINEEPAGFVQLYPTFSSVALQRAYILNDLYVDQNFRQQGIGRRLIERCYEYCKEKEARYLTLETAKDNKKAQKLYEQMGMEQEEMLHYSKYWANDI